VVLNSAEYLAALFQIARFLKEDRRLSVAFPPEKTLAQVYLRDDVRRITLDDFAKISLS
jgi:predicted SAM-dependent methyltransferase